MANPVPPKLTYPCRFPIKAFLRPDSGAESRVRRVVQDAIGVPSQISRQLSGQGNYTCLTFDFVADSEDHVARVRAVLRAEPAVLMSL